MKYAILVFSVFLISCQKPSESQPVVGESASTNAVIGGDEVKAQNPLAQSVVALFNEQTESLCTGAFIGEGYILTAAHCVSENPNAIRVILDQVVSKNSPSIYASEVYIHPLYNVHRSEDIFDIAVIVLRVMPKSYKPMALLESSSEITKGLPVVVAGYGLNWSWGLKRGSGVLRATTLTVERPYFGNVEMLIEQSLRKGICSGDSGGPVMISKNGQFYIAGIASRSDSIPLLILPDCFISAVATRVDFFTPWIYSIIAEP